MEAKGLHVWCAKNSSDYAGGRTGPPYYDAVNLFGKFFFFFFKYGCNSEPDDMSVSWFPAYSQIKSDKMHTLCSTWK